METTPPASPPAHGLVFFLWLTTLLFGAILLAGFSFYKSGLGNAIIITLGTTIYAATLSSPILLVLPFMTRWAFKAATRVARWGRLLVAVVGSFMGATTCAYLVLGAGKPLIEVFDVEIFLFAVSYLPAAILAAICIYRPWLFRP